MTEMKHAGADLTAQKSIYETLRSINVSDHTEKKNGLTYLSWAWAWDTLMLYYPNSTVDVKRDKNGRFWFDDGFTGWVEVEVTIRSKNETVSRSELFPIMDYKNRSIPADQITSFSANTAVQRATTKAIARHGLGLYVYAGEDLPPTEDTADLLKQALKARQRLADSLKGIGEDIDSEKIVADIKKKAHISSCDPAQLSGDELDRLLKVYATLQKGADRKLGEMLISDPTPTF